MFHWGLAAGQRISPSPSTMSDGTWAELKTQSSCHLNVSQRWLLSFEVLPITLWFVEALILIVRLASIWGYKKGRSIRTDIWALLLIAWKGVWVETVSNVSTVTDHNCTDSGSRWHHHNRMVALVSGILHLRFCPERGSGDRRSLHGTHCRNIKKHGIPPPQACCIFAIFMPNTAKFIQHDLKTNF